MSRKEVGEDATWHAREELVEHCSTISVGSIISLPPSASYCLGPVHVLPSWLFLTARAEGRTRDTSAAEEAGVKASAADGCEGVSSGAGGCEDRVRFCPPCTSPLLFEKELVIVVGEGALGVRPRAPEAGAVGVATADGVGTREGNDLLVAEAHACATRAPAPQGREEEG